MKLISNPLIHFCLLAGTAFGSLITQVGSRAGLGANDLAVWDTIPANDGTSVVSPYVVNTPSALSVTATLAGGFIIYQQGAGTFAGNFAANEFILDSAFTDGPISISFSSAVRGVGFNIQRNDYGLFTGSLSLFGAGNVLFGTVTVAGNSTNAGNGTAVFLGATGSLRDIVRIDVSVSNAVAGSNALDLNQLSLLTTNPIATPEPASIGLTAGALLCLFAMRRRV